MIGGQKNSHIMQRNKDMMRHSHIASTVSSHTGNSPGGKLTGSKILKLFFHESSIMNCIISSGSDKSALHNLIVCK